MRTSTNWIGLLTLCFLLSQCATTKPFASKLRILALGDSYTIGESVAVGQTFPAQFRDSLIRLGHRVDLLQIVARTGWRTDELWSAIARQKPRSDQDIVTLLIGVNNQYQGRSSETYHQEFRKLLRKAIQLAGGRRNRVFVLSIPDYAFTPFGRDRDAERISRKIDTFNAVNRRVAADMHVTYVDITDISREGLSSPALVARDSLHPSAVQYTAWVERLMTAYRSKKL